MCTLERLAPRWDAIINRGSTGFMLGRAQRLRGGDAPATLAAALADLGRALESRPDLPSTLVSRGAVHHELAQLAFAAGADPGPALAAARADYDRALAEDANSAQTWFNRAEVARTAATFARKRGEVSSEVPVNEEGSI